MSPPAVYDLYHPKTEILEILQTPTLTSLGRIGVSAPMRHIPIYILDLLLVLPHIEKTQFQEFQQFLQRKKLPNSPVIVMRAFLRLVVIARQPGSLLLCHQQTTFRPSTIPFAVII